MWDQIQNPLGNTALSSIVAGIITVVSPRCPPACRSAASLLGVVVGVFPIGGSEFEK